MFNPDSRLLIRDFFSEGGFCFIGKRIDWVYFFREVVGLLCMYVCMVVDLEGYLGCGGGCEWRKVRSYTKLCEL